MAMAALAAGAQCATVMAAGENAAPAVSPSAGEAGIALKPSMILNIDRLKASGESPLIDAASPAPIVSSNAGSNVGSNEAPNVAYSASIGANAARPAGAAESALPRSLSLSAALQRALVSNADVLIQAEQVRIGQSQVLEANAPFDPEIVSSATREKSARPLSSAELQSMVTAGNPNVLVDRSRNTAYRVGVTRTFESGVSADVGVAVASTASTLGTANGNHPNSTTGSLHFNFRVPLQRNAGGVLLSTAREASELERDASIEDLVERSATASLSTVQTYWEIAGRVRRLDILRSSEKRASDLVKELRELVAADQIPAAELHLALASEAEKRAARIGEEQLLQQAWTNLGRLLQADAGDAFSGELSVDALPVISPEILGSVRALTANVPMASAAALERRADVRAARLRESATRRLVGAAQNNLKPQFDLIAGVVTNGIAEPSSSLSALAAVTGQVPAPALSVGFELHWPVEHTAARALLLSRSALHQQSIIRLRDVQRGVAPAITTVAASILRVAARYEETSSAASRYLTSVQNEQVKRRLGISTLIDVLNVQDRLDAAQLELLQLRQEYAVQLGQLLFEFGSLVRRNSSGFDIEVPALHGTRPFRVDS